MSHDLRESASSPSILTTPVSRYYVRGLYQQSKPRQGVIEEPQQVDDKKGEKTSASSMGFVAGGDAGLLTTGKHKLSRERKFFLLFPRFTRTAGSLMRLALR